jgi:OOP family OmpA-OmpF porin
MTEVKPFKLGSMFMQAGAGLKFKINRRIDLEGRLMYVVTGDDEFDGGGNAYSDINKRSSQVSDNFFNATLGLSVKLGKHESHLMWHDPFRRFIINLTFWPIKTRISKYVKKEMLIMMEFVMIGTDSLTLLGARVDGAGVALDTDLDGVIDLYDKCVTVPGPVENNGCPTTTTGPVIETETKLEGIEFDLNSDRILPSNTPILNNAVNYINSSNGSYNVVGATDTRGTDAYNQKLSERRANNVKNYLIKNGVQSGKLNAVGKGEKDLKYPE